MMDSVSDALTRIRNAVKVGHKTVTVPNIKLVVAIVDVLKKEEFITDYSVDETGVVITLAYDSRGPVMSSLTRVSKPGQRIYAPVSSMKKVMSGRGIGIVSTSSGVMTLGEARKRKIGGEYICSVW
jgi:small subunit ribosomal protein S8